MIPYNKKLKPLARTLRQNMTDAEQLIWYRIRRKQLARTQFYRQRPIGPFIVDFYSPKACLVIEIDGGQHFEPAHRQKDLERDAWLMSRGLHVLRFDNIQVLTQTDEVVEEILRWLVESGVG
jgi:very-short-patch-repair endonuclease